MFNSGLLQGRHPALTRTLTDSPELFISRMYVREQPPSTIFLEQSALNLGRNSLRQHEHILLWSRVKEIILRDGGPKFHPGHTSSSGLLASSFKHTAYAPMSKVLSLMDSSPTRTGLLDSRRCYPRSSKSKNQCTTSTLLH